MDHAKLSKQFFGPVYSGLSAEFVEKIRRRVNEGEIRFEPGYDPMLICQSQRDSELTADIYGDRTIFNVHLTHRPFGYDVKFNDMWKFFEDEIKSVIEEGNDKS